MALLLKLLWTGFGLGLSPIMPGTCGTLVGVLLVLGLARTGAPQAWLLGVLGVVCVLSVVLAPVAARSAGRGDPPSFVVDEVAGYLVTLIGLPLDRPWVLAGAFVAFRVFDIVKPPPVRQLERIPGGWGVLADDLMAGVLGNVCVRVVLWLL